MAAFASDMCPPLVSKALIGEATVRRADPGGFAFLALVAHLHGIEVDAIRGFVEADDNHVRPYTRRRIDRGKTRGRPCREINLRVREGES